MSMRRGPRVTAGLALALALVHCGGDGDDSASESDVAEEVGRTGGRNADAADSAQDPADAVIIDDAFVRPPRPTDVGATDGADGTGEDGAQDSDDGVDAAADASVDPAADTPSDSAGDTAGDAAELVTFTGESGCFRWTVNTASLAFDFKVDDFLVDYLVENICVEAMSFRVDHRNDFFPLALHQDGELWTYLGECPGMGPPHEWTFAGFAGGAAEGIRRGFRWTASAHEALLEFCDIEFDRSAEYTMVGYGNRPLEGTETRSALFVMTDAIPITINF